MALIINIVKDSINDSGTELNLKDSTGLYVASDNNPTGYGGPNPNRTDIAIILLPYNKRQDEGDVLCTTQNYNPVVDETFVVNLHKDGWYQVKTFGLRLYNVNTSFAISEAVYDVSSQTIRKILTKSGTGPYTYTYSVIQPIDLVGNTVVILYQSVLNSLVIPGICKCWSAALKAAMNSIAQMDPPAIVNENIEWQQYQKIDTYLNSIKNSFGFSSYPEAQKKVEQVENLCDCFGNDNCNC